MNKLPNEIIRQIRKFDSHPVADLFKEAVKIESEELYEIRSDFYGPGIDYCKADNKSFADYFFAGSIRSNGIYKYKHMDAIYIETLKEYLRNSRK